MPPRTDGSKLALPTNPLTTIHWTRQGCLTQGTATVSMINSQIACSETGLCLGVMDAKLLYLYDIFVGAAQHPSPAEFVNRAKQSRHGQALDHQAASRAEG